jgi:hypothetical protein
MRSTRTPFTPGAAARGYTIVVVLLAMTVLTIGAAGAMTMEKVSMQGNLDARKTDIATNIGRMWLERIQRDSMSWTQGANFANAQLLGNANNAVGNWFLPTAYAAPASGSAAVSPAFDILGRDLPGQAPFSSAFFCVHLRTTWLASNNTNQTNSLMRVELRVVWPRGIALDAFATPLCDTAPAATQNPDPRLYSTLYMVTAVRANATQ